MGHLKRVDVSKRDRVIINGHSSKGYQNKWKVNDVFIKQDCLGYESVAEAMVSTLLRWTDIPKEDYVTYEVCMIYEDQFPLGRGCCSNDFIKGKSEVSLLRLMQFHGLDINTSYDDIRIELYDTLGFDIKEYVDRLLALDAITRNEDRHLNNITFLYEDGVYKPSPIFDNGAACLSDLVAYPMDRDFDNAYESVLAKPFNSSFTRQLVNITPITIDVNGFERNLQVEDIMTERAYKVIKRGLKEMEGLAWTRP